MRRYARARHVPGQMNGLERAYALVLDQRIAAGLAQCYLFERVKLKLADDTTYTPDFMVIAADDTLELHEVKGFMRDDARVKLKVAATMFPWFRFKLATRKGGVWSITDVEPAT